ncbi:MAG: sugar-binding domain-containing protein [Deinococcales bacterium]
MAAAYLNSIIEPKQILALAWGTTVSAISKKLSPKKLLELQVVQLNGSGNTHDAGISYSSEILRRFADAYGAQSHPFPVPTFFDYPETKTALWKERSIKRLLKLQSEADILLYSIGAFDAGVPSHVYTGNYLEAKDLKELKKEAVVGDIATVFFRADGSYGDIPLNARASGPDLKLFAKAKHALCAVAGKAKITGLKAALKGGYLNKLIIDEPSARQLLVDG